MTNIKLQDEDLLIYIISLALDLIYAKLIYKL